MIKDETTREAQQSHQLPVQPAAEVEITKAIRRVYKQYGQDLSAFFRDVQQELHQDEQKREQLPLFPVTAKRS